MKKTANLWRRMLVGIALMLTMCLALVGCGGGGGSAESKLIGYWELSGGTLEGEDLDDEFIQMMKDWDAHMIIHFAEDGKCEVDMFGDVYDATWDAKAKTMEWEGETVEFKLDGDALSINDGSDHIEFKKGNSTDLASIIETDRSNMTRSGTDSTTSSDVEPAMTPSIPSRPSLMTSGSPPRSTRSTLTSTATLVLSFPSGTTPTRTSRSIRPPA